MELLNLSISGAVSGAVYSLLAIGLVLSYSTSRIFNFGHAATAFACAYLYYQLHVALGWNKWLTLVAVVLVFAPLMGWAWDKLVFSRLSGAAESTKIVAGVGVLIVVPALVVWICNLVKDVMGVGFVDTAEVYQVPGILPARLHKLGEGLILSNDQLLALAASIVLFLLLWGLLRFTRLGLRMRVAVDSPSLAALRGINTSRVSALSWLMSFFLAGVAGVLAAPFPGPFGLVNENYTLALFVATTAAVVGSLRSIPIAFAVGLSLGAIRNLVVAYVNGDHLGVIGAKIAEIYGLTASVPYLALFAALVIVGHDRKRRKAGTTSSGAVPVPDYQSDLTRLRRAVPLLLRGGLVLIVGLFFANGIWIQLIIVGLATGIILMSFTVVTGLGGMVSLAQGTFATAAALTAGLLIHHGWPFALAVLAGMGVAGVLGALTALPAMRLNGLMLTFATLALALLGTGVLFKIEWFTNGTLGWKIPRPRFGPVDLANDRVMLVACFSIMLAVAWLVSNLQNSASGRAMIAVRTAEPAAAASAVSPQTTKLLIFTISAIIAGLGGVLLVTVHGSVLGTANPPQQSFLWLAVVVLLGLNRPSSAIEAGLVVALMPQIIGNGFHIGGFGWNGTSDDLILQILFGIGAITLANRPDGMLAAEQRSARARRDKKRARKQAALSPAQETTPSAASAEVRREQRAQIREGAAGEVVTAGTPATGLLELHDIHAGYGEVEVLHGITLTIPDHTSLALLGANGSGKSTLCSVVAGLVPTASGRIVFNGEDITALSTVDRVERGIVLVPESRGVFPSVSVEENLAIWLPNKHERAKAYDAFTPLAARKNQPAGNLSGGEQQMLSLAPLLVRNPRLLIADEPSLGLAQIITTQIMDALRLLHSEGTTILLVEEKARDIRTVADHVGALQRGTLQWIAKREDVDEQLVTAAYLGLSTVVDATH